MIPQTTNRLIRLFTRGLLALTFVSSSAIAAPPKEKPSQTLKRTVESGLSLQTELSKNRFRTETYEDKYTVQVPYQEVETYYEQVPYQTTETYYEKVPYQATETQYVQVPYQDTEYYTDYEQRCEQQRRCQNVPHQSCNYEQRCTTVPDQQCRQERVCSPIPGEQNCREVTECGTNALGQQICKTRKVCEQGPSREDCGFVQKCENTSRQECRNEQVCRTDYREECRYENECRQVPVQKQRTVTKYRQESRQVTVTKYREEARQREVTKYRQEKRTRTVTKYRDEVKCCVTKTREVFERQDQVQVTVRFPQGTELIAPEAESFKVTLAGTLEKPALDFAILDSVFGYQVQSQNVQGATATVDLAVIAKHTAETVGPATVTNLRLLDGGSGAQLLFEDAGQKPRVQTAYSFEVRRADSKAVVAQGTGAATGQTKIKLPIQESLELDQNYEISLRVQRTGLVLAGQTVDFTKTAISRLESFAADRYQDESLVSAPSIEGETDAAVVVIKDLAPAHVDVQSTYKIKLERAATTSAGKRRLLLEKTLSAAEVTLDAQGEARFSLKTLGVKKEDLSLYFKKGKTVFTQITVVRNSARFDLAKPIQIQKDGQVKIP